MQLLEPMYLQIEVLHDQFIKTEAADDAYRSIGAVINKQKFNLSQVMYKNVKKTFKGNLGYEIQVSGFIPKYRPLLNALLVFLYNNRNTSTGGTLKEKEFAIMTHISWLRDNNHQMPLTLENARNAYVTYSTHLRSKIRLGAANHGTRKSQNLIKQFLESMHPDKKNNISERVPNIPSKEPTGKSIKNPTTVEEQDVNYALTYYYRFFHQVTDFLFENKTFPYAIELVEGSALITPFDKGKVLLNGYNKGNMKFSRQLNINEGRFLNDDEILESLESEDNWKTLSDRQKHLRYYKAKKQKEKYITDCKIANSDFKHTSRMELGNMAQKAFFMLFAGITGQNDSTLANLKWYDDDSFEQEKDSKGFITIKPRAKYKTIDFSIQRLLISSFRKFLKLRRYLLDGHECTSLFFLGYRNKARLEEYTKTGDYGQICCDAHSSVDPHLPRIATRKFRVAKNKWVLKRVNGDIWITAKIAGNTPSINATHYQGKNNNEINNELVDFLDLMSDKIKEHRNETNHSNLNQCDSFQNPIPDSDSIFEPDCNNWFYCFFCKHYGIHPDKDDIHKLISIKYIIERIASTRAKNEIHFQRVMGPVLKRIRILLVIMAKKHNAKSLIKDAKTKVYQRQELHWYWDIKLQQLWRIGAL